MVGLQEQLCDNRVHLLLVGLLLLVLLPGAAPWLRWGNECRCVGTASRWCAGDRVGCTCCDMQSGRGCARLQNLLAGRGGTCPAVVHSSPVDGLRPGACPHVQQAVLSVLLCGECSSALSW